MNKVLFGYDDLVGNWVMQQTGGIWQTGRGTAIGLIKENGNLVAGMIFDTYNVASCCIHIASLPNEQWLNKSFLWTLFAYPFLQLKVNKLFGFIGSNNKETRNFAERLGFTLEAALKDAHQDGDLMVYSITKDQCRWLTLKVPFYGRSIQAFSSATP